MVVFWPDKCGRWSATATGLLYTALLVNSHQKTFSEWQAPCCSHILLGTFSSFDKCYCCMTSCVKCPFFINCHYILRLRNSLKAKRYKVTVYIYVSVYNTVFTLGAFFPQLFQSSLVISQHDTIYTKKFTNADYWPVLTNQYVTLT